MDSAVANRGANEVSISLANADESFANPVEYQTGMAPSRIQTGDFNGDGIADLVTANSGDSGSRNADLSILLGKGGGSIQTPHSIPVGKASSVADVARSDFNEDGH